MQGAPTQPQMFGTWGARLGPHLSTVSTSVGHQPWTSQVRSLELAFTQRPVRMPGEETQGDHAWVATVPCCHLPLLLGGCPTPGPHADPSLSAKSWSPGPLEAVGPPPREQALSWVPPAAPTLDCAVWGPGPLPLTALCGDTLAAAGPAFCRCGQNYTGQGPTVLGLRSPPPAKRPRPHWLSSTQWNFSSVCGNKAQGTLSPMLFHSAASG